MNGGVPDATARPTLSHSVLTLQTLPRPVSTWPQALSSNSPTWRPGWRTCGRRASGRGNNENAVAARVCAAADGIIIAA